MYRSLAANFAQSYPDVRLICQEINRRVVKPMLSNQPTFHFRGEVRALIQELDLLQLVTDTDEEVEALRSGGE